MKLPQRFHGRFFFPIATTLLAVAALGKAFAGSPPFTVQPLSPVVDRLPPVSMVRKAPGHFFFDFGADTFAGLELTVRNALPGQKVAVLLGEAISDAQTVNPKPGASIRILRSQVVLDPKTSIYRVPLAPHDWKGMEPRIGPVMPFRYVEIEDAPPGFKKEDIAKLDVHYPFDDGAASFDSSNPDLNAIWKLCRGTMKATSFSIGGVDGDRERIPYEADAYIQQLGWYCTTTDVTFPRYGWELLVNHPTWPTEWIMFNVLLAWNDYQYTGDTAGLRRFYPDLKAKTLIALERPDGLISTTQPPTPPAVEASIHFTNPKGIRDIVDWPRPGDSDGYEFKPVNTVVNAFHVIALRRMAEIAAAVGHTGDAAMFSTAASRTQGSINAKLFDPASGLYVDGEGSTHSSMHANFFPLAFGIIPPARQAKVIAYLAGRNMDCSVYGAQFFLDALFEHGQADRAIALMTAPGDRSWLHMVRSGATMTWEAWNTKDKPNLDWNHAWGAAPANLIPRDLMGIRPIAPGFSKVLIAPRPGSLARAAIRVPTVKGAVSAAFDNTGGAFRLNIDIPSGMAAKAGLPTTAGDGPTTLLLDGKPAAATVSAGTAYLDGIGAGKHIITR